MNDAGAAPACPKDMTHGPCGGVREDGVCELGTVVCPFVDAPAVRWRGNAATPVPLPPMLRPEAAPFVLADLPHAPLDARAVSEAAAALAGHADAVLFGDTGWARTQLPPSYRAMLVAREGLLPWAGLNCRDRNRVALEAEVAALADVGAVVHCVTGDHTELGHRPDARPVFDLDSTQLAALAASYGVVVSVGENPVAPPVDRRAARLAEKARAGAAVCVVNHAGTAARVAAFIDAARQAGAGSLAFLVCVPLVASEAGLALLQTFTALALPPGYLATIIEARDPKIAGIDAAVAFATEVLAIDGVRGVDISSAVPAGDELVALDAIATVCDAIRP